MAEINTQLPDYSAALSGNNNLLSGVNNTVDLANKFGQNKLIGQDIQGKKIENYAKTLSVRNQVLSSLMGKDDLSQKDIKDAVVDMVGSGILPAENAVKIINDYSSVQDDPTALKKHLLPYALQGMSAEERLKQVYGSPVSVDQGPNKLFGTQSPAAQGGGLNTASTLPLGLSPGEAATPTQIPDASGNTTTMTRGQFVGAANGGGGASVPDNILAARGGVPSNPDGSGPTPMVNGQPAPAALPGIKGPPVGLEKTMEASAGQGMQLQHSADSSMQRKALLGEMESALGDFNSGPGAEKWKNILAGANRFGANIAVDRVASQEEFTKLATQLAQQQFQTLGGTGTDSKLDSAMHTSPSTALSNLGNKRIISLLKGNEDAIKVKNQEWQQWKAKFGPGTYGPFSSKFNESFDPRVFQAQYMSPKEVNNLYKGMNTEEQKSYRKAFNDSVDHGWIPDKRGANEE